VSADYPDRVTGAAPLVTLSVWGVSTGAAIPLTAGSVGWRAALRRTPGVRFVRVLGTAAGGAMGPTDADPRHWALLVAWDDPDAAADLGEARLTRAFDACAYERLTVRMRPLSSRGLWGGRDPFGDTAGAAPHVEDGRGPPRAPRAPDHTSRHPRPSSSPSSSSSGPGPPRAQRAPDHTSRRPRPSSSSSGGGPVAAITRARLAPRRMRRFYRAARPVAADLARADGLLLALGIGEAPVGLQGTVSLWRSAADLTAFAYGREAHADVVRRTPAEGWYAEELFARFAVLGVEGRYRGRAVGGA
jgi:hypothetical protein